MEKKNTNEFLYQKLISVILSKTFFWYITVIYTIWILWNLFVPQHLRLDDSKLPILLVIINFTQLMFLPILQAANSYVQVKSLNTHSLIRSQLYNVYRLLELVETINRKNIESQNKIREDLQEIYTILNGMNTK